MTIPIARLGRQCSGILVVLALWEGLAAAGIINAFLFPPPSSIISTLGDMLADGSLVQDSLASLERVVTGFALAAFVGIALGIVLGWWRPAADVLKPIVEALRPVPPIAWTPLAILWFGIGNAPSYFLVFIGAVFPVFVSTLTAVRAVERTQINAALCLGATPKLLITDIIVPASLPIIFPGLRIALGVGWMCVVAAELIAAQSGLGYMIQQSRMLLQTPKVLTGMVVIGAIGFAMNAAMLQVERWLVPWRGSETRA